MITNLTIDNATAILCTGHDRPDHRAKRSCPACRRAALAMVTVVQHLQRRAERTWTQVEEMIQPAFYAIVAADHGHHGCDPTAALCGSCHRRAVRVTAILHPPPVPVLHPTEDDDLFAVAHPEREGAVLGYVRRRDDDRWHWFTSPPPNPDWEIPPPGDTAEDAAANLVEYWCYW